MLYHHGTIRKYTSALLNFFNNIEVQYVLSNKELQNKKIPLRYAAVEKSKLFDDITQEQLLSGNYNILPRGALALSSIDKNSDRTPNKNLKVNLNRVSNERMEFMYNSVPYEFAFDLIYQCRGMNEATQIIEQIAVKFNPLVHIDVWDANNLSATTRIPVKLTGINLETEEYDTLSSNIVTVSFGLVVVGSLYQPVQTDFKVENFKMYFNQLVDEVSSKREEMYDWDIDHRGKIDE